MLHQLEKEQYAEVEHLFVQNRHHVFCAGVLSGKYEGQIFVDDLDKPTSALAIKPSSWWYFGGDAHNEPFNEALRVALVERNEIGKDVGALLIDPESPAWIPVIHQLVAGREGIATGRRLYIADTQHFDPNYPLADGFSLHFIDESLREKVAGDLPGDVQDVLQMRAGTKNPDEMAFGFVAVHEQKCVAQAYIDCIVYTRGEIGLYTDGNFRRLGLATAVSAATIEYALAHGITAVHWDCAFSNLSSNRVAQKLGLQQTLEHDQYLIVFDEVGHLLNVAWTALDEGSYEKTMTTCQPLLQAEKQSKYTYFLAGTAAAGLGDDKAAFGYLETAVSLGWDDLVELENQPILQPLQQQPQWQHIVAHIQKNRVANE